MAVGPASFCAKLLPDLWKTLIDTFGTVSPASVVLAEKNWVPLWSVQSLPQKPSGITASLSLLKCVAIFLWKLSTLHCYWQVMRYRQKEILWWRQVPLFSRYSCFRAYQEIIVVLCIAVHQQEAHFMVITCTMSINWAKGGIHEITIWKAYKYRLTKESDLSSLTILPQKTYTYQYNATML